MLNRIKIFPSVQILRMGFMPFLCTLNLALILVGYPLAASLLKPLGYTSEQSQIITVPYRGFALILSVLCFAYGLYRERTPQMSNALIVFFFCMGLGITRIFFDMFSDETGYASTESLRVWGFVVSTLFASLSVYTTYKLIRYDIGIVAVLLICIYVTILAPLGIGETSEDLILDIANMRASGSSALYSIAYGFIGALGIILSVYVFFSDKYSIFFKLFTTIIIYLGAKALLASGSRSPLFDLFVVSSLYIITTFRQFAVVVILISCTTILAYFMRLQIVNIISEFSPVLGNRLTAMFLDGDYSGRDILVAEGIDKITQNPLLGVSTIDPKLGLNPLCGFHTSVIDSFAYFGLVGGTIFLLFLIYLCYISFVMMTRRRMVPNFWVVLVLLAYLTNAFFASGLFFVNPPFAAFSVLGILFYNDYIKHKNYRSFP